MRFVKSGKAALPDPPAPSGMYLPINQHGLLLFASSMDSSLPGSPLPTGIVGADVSADDARDHAGRCALNILAAISAATGTLDAVDHVVHIRGLIRATPEFADHPRVLDGCSEKLLEVLGDRGRHSRSVMGVSSLPGGTTIEIEAIISLLPGWDESRGSANISATGDRHVR